MSVPRDGGGGGRGADLLELARSLRQELLYVNYEKKQLQHINEAVASASRQLAHSAWIAHQQRENLDGLVMSRPECSPSHCCQRANLLLQTGFIDAYKQLQHHQVNYTEFLVAFRNKSKLVAACLAAGDKIAFRLGNVAMSDIVVAVFSGLFGSCLLPEDEAAMIDLLHNLMDIQLLTSSNPRKLLRHGNCSFSRLYKVFSDQLFSSKLFLTSALHEPILYLLTNDEIFLDIDPEKAVIRFRSSERLRKFGKQGTPEYEKKVKAHRQEIISKLVSVTNRFISGIRDNLHCFPPNLARLLRYLYRRMTDSGRMEAKEVNAVCVDVLFTLFIFPAIVDPEPMGIIDMPISYIARFNLMQVAQILQVLALWKWEEVSPNLQDLYSNFDRDAMPGVLEALLDPSAERHDPSPSPVVSDGVLSRLAVLLTGDQLHAVIEWLRAVRDRRAAAEDVIKELEALLAPLPPAVPGRRKTPSAAIGNHVSVSSPGRSGGDATDGDSDASSSSPAAAPSSTQSFGHRQKAVLAAKLSNVSTRGRATQRPQSGESQAANNLATAMPEKVLILPVTDSASELPGLASEESVIRKSRQASGNSNRVRMNLSGLEDGSLTSASGEVQEKRTRFSLSHDDGSIGNASDNLEAISEAASNHSVASSLEDEVDQGDQTIDNMSDMVSANVSGRGTPNVSGRDTPSSQVTEEEEPACDERVMQPVAAGAAPNSNVLTGRKNGEPDMEEKFGRFEIKPEVRRGRIGQLGGTGPSGDRDEAVSMVSDTWSTDVLSSDTETVGEPPTLEDLLRGRPGDEFNPRYGRGRLLDQLTVPGGDGGRDAQAPISAASHLLDVSETGSEAWSMDVLASDTESLRLADLDLEDSVSVARSDDTRFTDDTTRSDPADNLQREDLTDYGGGTLTRGAVVGDVPRNAAVEQWAELSRVRNAGVQQAGTRRDSDGSNHSTRQAESILKKPHMLGIMPVTTVGEAVVCLDDSAVTDGGGSMIANVDVSSIATSVRLSTTSIASSASSHGSGGSADVLPHLKSRSNSSGGTSVSGNIGEQPLMPESSTPVIQAEVAVEQENRRGVEQESRRGVEQEIRPSASLAAPGPSTGAMGASTGAIPKSISFDKSADKEEEGEHKYGVGKRDTRSFFKSWKLPKISRRGGGARGSKSEEYHRSTDRLTNDAFNIPEHDEGPCLRRAASDDPKPSASLETSDDILAKYRKKQGEDKSERVAEATGAKEEVDGDCDRLSIDPENVETSFAFQDAQRKLRLALSEADLPLLYSLPDRPGGGMDGGGDGRDTDVVSLLKFMLAEAHNQQDRNTQAQLHETLRCVSVFDQDACNKLLRCLRADYQRRSPYIAYLVRSRNGLLSTLAHLERLNSRMESDQKMCSKFLISVCVRLFLEKKEEDLQQLLGQFSSASLMDEKAEMINNFLEQLWSNLEQDNTMLAAANPEQMQEARITVERAIFSQIYMAALYPNQEADAQRDLSLQEHISKLSNVVTPSHKDIKIPKRYHYECPWPSAQAELRRLAAFKMPSDKVACIARVATTIMNLLSLAAEKSVPAADDFLPVLVFVIIKANPPSLLSTVQFVDNFYGSRLSGENCYWWMQFVAAIEFIKTMDYKLT